MYGDQIQAPGVTAAEARDHVVELEAERTLARTVGVSGIHLYMYDLEAELALWREQYATAAVTEIATLRAELFGANFG